MNGRYIQIGYHPETMQPVFVWLTDKQIAEMLATQERDKCCAFE